MTVPVVLADTVTTLAAHEHGAVLVSGSHGGVIAARYAVQAGVRAVIFNDAGVGLDAAGIAGLPWLAAHGIAAAAVSHATARIADARDALAHGRISHANGPACTCGVVVGESCRLAADKLRAAPFLRVDDAFAPGEGRHALAPDVVGLDSIGLVAPADAAYVLVIGSHGALHGGDPGTALGVPARAAFFHDAGLGKDEAGVSRLPVLAQRGIPAATVDYRTARIGDARSMHAGGVLSRINAPMRARGVREGDRVRDAAEPFA